MAKNLRWKVVLILAVIGLSIWSFYPLNEKIRLGLDLKGGVHLVLRVQTDDALRLETETTADRLREQLKTANIGVGAITVTSVTEFSVAGVPQEQDQAFRGALTEAELNYNRASGVGGSYTFTLKPNIAVQLREDTVNQALQTIERRVNELGVAEPIVARHSAADQILVQMPGVTDVARAKEIIRSTALLELKQVEQGPFSDEAPGAAGVRRQRAARHPHHPGPERVGPGPAVLHRVLRRAPRAHRDGPRPAHRASPRSTRTTARR